MYFKRLELLGFKSFADKTLLHFEPGVTAIVGPNGCGKSNIFDAIRWVLGEQSVKAMRGASMEDVIFNGTSLKPALGFAEVSLTFSNENKFFPLDYSEITISRRLFRSGESEYLINKSQVRLKDVSELLMGTGIASESYSLVEQGKIDLVLSSRPEDRRAIFDEAAGITKYKARKKEALNKLEDTEENLVRLADIINEVQRQIGSVERQAAKARRYQEHFQRLKDLEVKKALHELQQFQQELKVLSDKKASSGKEQAEFEGLIEKLSSELEDFNAQLNDIITSIETSDIEALKADSLVERFKDQIKVNQERIQEYEQRIDALAKEKELITSRLINEKSRLASLKGELSSFDENLAAKQEQLKSKQDSLATIARDIEAGRQDISAAKKNILEITNQLTRVKNDSLKVTNDLTTLAARKHRLQIEKAKVAQEKESADSKLQEEEQRVKERNQAITGLKEALNTKKESLASAQSELKQIEVAITELEKELASLQSQKEFLLNLKTKYVDTGSSREGFIILDAGDLKPGMGILGKIEVIETAAPDSNLPGKSLKRIRCQLKVIDLDLDKITKQESEVSKALSEDKSKKDSFSQNIQSLTGSIAAQEKTLKEEEILLANINTHYKMVADEAGKLEQEAEVVEEELAEVLTEVGSLVQAEEKAKERLQDLESQTKQLENSIGSNQDLIVELAKKREQSLVDIAQLETTLASFTDKRADLENSLRLIESSLTQDLDKEKSNLVQIEDAHKRIGQLTQASQQCEREIEETKHTKGEVLRQLDILRKKKEEVLEKTKEKQALLNEKNAQLNRIRQAEFQLNSKEQEVNYQILNLKNRIEASYHTSLDPALVAIATLAADELARLEQDIKALKEKVDAYGVVNLVAIEEHEELKKRLEFLTSQQKDLLAAKESIHKAIARINQTTRKMFKDTFEKIQVNFKDYFKLLFNGGDAQLFLTDENNILESGIEIVCRPPGKKLQNISLLSGGEKSMSAIALIFAVFKVKPSPFCILDEIDAALDETNIDRYNRVLQEFLATTQFIIITHNKKTITNADVMYGITMQESGVSKIVSVKFAKEKEKPAKEPAAKEPTALN
jgi:chromosome segregation protein